VPDFENFLAAVACRGEPKRVPQFDGSIYEDFKVRLLGRPILGLADEVDFWMEAGYYHDVARLGEILPPEARRRTSIAKCASGFAPSPRAAATAAARRTR